MESITNAKSTPRPRVVIVGGGFGGLAAVRALRKAPVDVTLVDRRNFHLFQPLLYQVAAGMLSPANIAAPLRVVLRRYANVSVILGDVVDVDVESRRVVLSDGELAYDWLVLAVGSQYNYFGHTAWQEFAPSLKSLEDATEIRGRIFSALEAAEREDDPEMRRQLLTFAVVGGGPTGVEMAGTLAELTRHSLRRDFRRIRADEPTILLIEGIDRVLSGFPPKLSERARQSMEELGVTVRLNTRVTNVRPGVVHLTSPAGEEDIRAATLLWTAGVEACPLNHKLAAATGTPQDRIGRLMVEPMLSLPGYPEIFAIGDMAHFVGDDGKPLPGLAPVAIQQGKHAAEAIRTRLHGEQPQPFRYKDRGTLATIGRKQAVASFGFIRVSGFVAWIIWLFVHLMQLVSFQNRILVLIQWAWNYVTFNRSACLISQPATRDNPKEPPPT